jgi:hypothetical protein
MFVLSVTLSGMARNRSLGVSKKIFNELSEKFSKIYMF